MRSLWVLGPRVQAPRHWRGWCSGSSPKVGAPAAVLEGDTATSTQAALSAGVSVGKNCRGAQWQKLQVFIPMVRAAEVLLLSFPCSGRSWPRGSLLVWSSARLEDRMTHIKFLRFLMGPSWFLCSSGLPQLLHCIPKLSQSYFHQ